MGLNHKVSNERVSSGIPRLDTMLGGEGFYRGTSILVGGIAGTGKSTMAAHFVDSACRRGERAIIFAFEESPAQIVRNMKSVGIDLQRWLDEGLLRFHAARPMIFGLEMHLVQMYRIVEQFKPSTVAIDPISNLIKGGSLDQASAMVIRLVDYFKSQGVTAMYTNLTHRVEDEQTDIGISSLMDTWLIVRYLEEGGERNRGVNVLKARGIAHSNQIREFRITQSGIDLMDVSLGPEGVLTGSARLAQEARIDSHRRSRERENARRRRALERQRAILKAKMAELQADFAAAEEELLEQVEESAEAEDRLARDREAMAVSRNADLVADDNGKANRSGAQRSGRTMK
jgi:circadian clock protein KaiC